MRFLSGSLVDSNSCCSEAFSGRSVKDAIPTGTPNNFLIELLISFSEIELERVPSEDTCNPSPTLIPPKVVEVATGNSKSSTKELPTLA